MRKRNFKVVFADGQTEKLSGFSPLEVAVTAMNLARHMSKSSMEITSIEDEDGSVYKPELPKLTKIK